MHLGIGHDIDFRLVLRGEGDVSRLPYVVTVRECRAPGCHPPHGVVVVNGVAYGTHVVNGVYGLSPHRDAREPLRLPYRVVMDGGVAVLHAVWSGCDQPVCGLYEITVTLPCPCHSPGITRRVELVPHGTVGHAVQLGVLDVSVESVADRYLATDRDVEGLFLATDTGLLD